MEVPTRKLWCDGHGTAQNIIPASADAAKAVVKDTPEVNKKLPSTVFHYHSPNVSFVDLICCLKIDAKYDGI